MTHSKAPNCVVKAVFLIAPSWIPIWSNPLTMSLFERTAKPPSVLDIDWIEGKGHRGTVQEFKAR